MVQDNYVQTKAEKAENVIPVDRLKNRSVSGKFCNPPDIQCKTIS